MVRSEVSLDLCLTLGASLGEMRGWGQVEWNISVEHSGLDHGALRARMGSSTPLGHLQDGALHPCRPPKHFCDALSLSVAQAELAVILKFVLDHEDGLNLNEDLESFLQKGK